MNCPSCKYDGGQYGHVKQINPENPNDWICSSCSFTFKKEDGNE